MIPIGKSNTGPIDYLAPIAAGPVGVEQFWLPLRRPCRVCGWRRLLTLAGQVICTNCQSRERQGEGKVLS